MFKKEKGFSWGHHLDGRQGGERFSPKGLGNGGGSCRE